MKIDAITLTSPDMELSFGQSEEVSQLPPYDALIEIHNTNPTLFALLLTHCHLEAVSTQENESFTMSSALPSSAIAANENMAPHSWKCQHLPTFGSVEWWHNLRSWKLMFNKLHLLGFIEHLESSDLDKYTRSNEQNCIGTHWDSFVSIYYFTV